MVLLMNDILKLLKESTVFLVIATVAFLTVYLCAPGLYKDLSHMVFEHSTQILLIVLGFMLIRHYLNLHYRYKTKVLERSGSRAKKQVK